MGNLAVDYGQASVVSRNISSALTYLEEEIAKINAAISEIESLNRGYGKTSTILNELYDQKKKAQTTYDEMKQFSEKFNGFIKNVKTTDSEMAKKFTADVKTYCKKNNIEITSEFDAFLDKVQVVLDVVGVIPVFGDVADGLNAVISLCRGNYLEALICLVAILPMGDLLKGLKFADKAKDILKLGDKALTATKTVAKEGAEKLSKQMTKLVKSGKIDNVIATMDAGKDFVVKFKNGSTALIKKGDLSEFVCQAFNKGCFMAGTLVTTKEGLKPIEEVKIGEYVMSRNEESGETSYKKVTDTLIRSTYNICTIELENGKIKSTTGHLFMVKDKWWKAAAELKAGDILETADEQCQIVKSITVEEKGYPVTTYNLSVEDKHTFFVGKLGVLTHNMKGFTPCELADEVAEKATKGVSKAEAKLYNPVDFNGTVKVNDEVRDVSRRVYQRGDIDINYFDENTGLTNLERMKKGKPPIGGDGNPIQLHHLTQQEAGSMVEIYEVTHQEYYSQLHGLVGKDESFRNNPILEKQYNNFRSKYWKWRYEQFTK